nr:hypothetical protein [Tanacetum cinerariifolium]
MDDAHYDKPLVYNVEGRFLYFRGPEFFLITWLHFESYSFRKFKSGDVTFVSRVLPYKLGLKVSNLDLLGLIEDEELLGKLVDDDAVCVCLLLALDVTFIGKKLVDEEPDKLMSLVENLVVWNDFRWGEYIWRHLYDRIMNVVNKNKQEHLKGLSKSKNYVPTYTMSEFVWFFKVIVDLTPTISEKQTFWYMAFRKFYMSYIPRSPPTICMVLFDDYMKKLSSSRKRGKIEIICRCDTTSVEKIRLKDGVIAKPNSRVFKLEAIIKEEKCRLKEHNMMKALFRKTLQEEVQRHDEKEKMLKYEEEKKKRDVSVDRRCWESLVCLDPTKKGWIMDVSCGSITCGILDLMTQIEPWLGSQPDNPLVNHGRELLERLTRANMRNAMRIMGARYELQRSIAEKVVMITNYRQM